MNPSDVKKGISPDNLRVSVVVPVHDDEARLAMCLEALAVQEVGWDVFEILVVDNASAAPPTDAVARYPFAKLLREPVAGSYAARNRGIAAARGEVLAFTDADCRPHRDWLARALAHFDTDSTLHVIGGRIELDASPSPGAAELYERLYAFPQDIYVRRDGFAATANMLAKRAVFERIGLFDAAVRSGGDRDWGQRASIAGFEIRYAADVVVSHPPRASLSMLVRKQRRVSGAGKSWGGDRTAVTGVDIELHDDLRLMGPRQTCLRLAFRPKKAGLAWHEGLRVLAVRWLLAWVGWFERQRILLGGTPTR